MIKNCFIIVVPHTNVNLHVVPFEADGIVCVFVYVVVFHFINHLLLVSDVNLS